MSSVLLGNKSMDNQIYVEASVLVRDELFFRGRVKEHPISEGVVFCEHRGPTCFVYTVIDNEICVKSDVVGHSRVSPSFKQGRAEDEDCNFSGMHEIQMHETVSPGSA